MNKLLMSIGLMFMMATGAANAFSRATEMDEPSRCAVGNKLSKENADARNFKSYVEVTDKAQREIIIDVITSHKFTEEIGQPYPNVTVEKIGVMQSPTGNILVIFADEHDCVWSFYVFDKEESTQFFNEITKRGA